MNILLDTHALLWVRGEPERFKSDTIRVLADKGSAVFVSVVSLWEIVIKCRVGKLKADIAKIIARLAPATKVQLLDLTFQHLIELASLPFRQWHRDPFDHLIIALAISEGMTLVTQDRNAAQVLAP
jgi:PIN domain nuclease of toxin-antitoxin system